MIHSRTTLLACLFAACGFLACGTVTTFTPLNQPPTPVAPRDPAQVEVFTTSKPTKHYVEVGVIESELAGVASEAKPKDLMQALRDEAGKHGCDAIVYTSEDKIAASNGLTASTGTLGFRATCIVYAE